MSNLLFLFLFLSKSMAGYSLSITNSSLGLTNFDSVDLGSVNHQLCESVNLKAASITEGGSTSTCTSESAFSERYINLTIPVRISLESTDGPMDVTVMSEKSEYSFQYFSLKNARNGVIGGGSELINSTITMQDGQIILGEIEIKAKTMGNNIPDIYSDQLTITISQSE